MKITIADAYDIVDMFEYSYHSTDNLQATVNAIKAMPEYTIYQSIKNETERVKYRCEWIDGEPDPNSENYDDYIRYKRTLDSYGKTII